MNNIVIITSYIDTNLSLLPYTNDADFIICLDGGWDIASGENILPDLIMGDMDSLMGELPENVPIERFKPEKDYSDLELALKKAAQLNAVNVTVIGGIGGRLDHTIANIQLLSQYTNCFDSLIMKDGRNKCFVINENQKKGIALPYDDNSYFSVFSLSEKCTGLTINNAKYPLTDYTLPRTGSLCVSNEFIGEKDAVLSIENGTLLVIISKK
ncbi:MAG: thiamine diphosphokinase [Firmicutes bacterium]|nr:thiamine diphosphokinase [Bacillota bacterium]